MAEAAQQRLQTVVSDAMNDLDRSHMRVVQKRMHLCAAKCCDDNSSSMDSVQTCMDRCAQPVKVIQHTMEAELGGFQDRISRCVAMCSDEARDKISLDTKESEMPFHKSQLETCIVKCANDHIALVPTLMKKCREIIDKTNKQYS